MLGSGHGVDRRSPWRGTRRRLDYGVHRPPGDRPCFADEIGRSARRSTGSPKRNPDRKRRVRGWRLPTRFSELSFLHLGSAVLRETVGLGAVARRLEALGLLQAVEKLNLDGMLALWHPSPGN
jgi:hypothetical protein